MQFQLQGQEGEDSRKQSSFPHRGQHTREDRRAQTRGSGAWKAGLLPVELKCPEHSEGLYWNLPSSSLELPGRSKDIENGVRGASVVQVKEPRGSPSASVGAGPSWRHGKRLCGPQGQSRRGSVKQRPSVGANADPPGAPGAVPCGAAVVAVAGRRLHPSRRPSQTSSSPAGAQLPPSGSSANAGLQEGLAPGQHGADALPPKGLPPHPRNRLSRMPRAGELGSLPGRARPWHGSRGEGGELGLPLRRPLT